MEVRGQISEVSFLLPGDWNEAVQFGSKHLDLLNHLASPRAQLLGNSTLSPLGFDAVQAIINILFREILHKSSVHRSSGN